MIARDGYRIIIYTAILTAISAFIANLTGWMALWVLTILLAMVFIFHFFFFRDPERTIQAEENVVLSPADGTIIKIDEVDEPVYIGGKAKRICIFMSVFNAHINRNPVNGLVEHLEHKDGQFLAAFADHAPDVNERTEIGVKTEYGKVFFMQIAGLIARRIVCRLDNGQELRAGERFGMIKYSSRVDIFLPLNTKIHVKLKDTVKAGLSTLGELKQ